MYFKLLSKYLMRFHCKNDLATVANDNFLLLDILSNFRRMANFSFDFN